MTSSIFVISLLLLSLSSSVFSDDKSFQKLPVPGKRSGPEAFAFDSTGKGFYTGVSGGKILKYTPENGFVDFALITTTSNSSWCNGIGGTALAKKCGRPAGIAFSSKTGELYVADAPLGLHVIAPTGGLATKLADSNVDGKPFKFLDGLDVDPTTGVVYFTSFSSKFNPWEVLIAVGLKDSTGKLFKYDPATKAVNVLMEGLSGAAGCAVSSDGSFVLVSEFIKSNIKRYWIKGPKAGTIEDFTSSVSNPDNIRRSGSSGDFWVASVVNKVVRPTNPSAVKVSAEGKVLQTIFLKNQFGDTLLSEVNEFDGNLYLGTLTGPFAGVMKL